MPAKKIPKRSTGVDSSVKINRAEAMVCEKKFNLSLEYQLEIRKKYKEYKSLLQLTKDIYQDQSLDENTDEFKNVKNFVTRIHSGQECHNFREEQIAFINEHGPTKRPMEITRILFREVDGNPIKECRSVVAVLDALGIKYSDDAEAPLERLGVYQPPSTDHKIIGLINRVDPEAGYHISKLDSEKRRRIALIKRSLNSPRVIAMLSAIRSQLHREVFETQFVLYLSDKDNVSVEDVSTIADLANENVRSLLITEEISLLNDRLAEASVGDDASRAFTKNLSDSLATKATEYNACQNRMIKLRDNLAISRADRMKHMTAINESLAKFIEMAKVQEGRDYMLKLSKMRESKLHDEAKRIESLSDLVAEIRGVDLLELLKF